MLVKEEKMASGPEPPLLQVQKSLSLHRNTSLNSSGQEGWILGGRFQLQQRIGVGGFANIYVAEDLCTGQRVALKAQSQEVTGNALRLEGEMLTRIDGKFAPKLMYTSTDMLEPPYLVMQLLSGEDLGDIIHRHRQSRSDPRVPLRTCVTIAKQITALLERLHGMGIVHRDIKPNNFMRENCQTKDLVMIDYGIAKQILDNGKMRSDRSGAEFKGTTMYASLRSHQQRELTFKDDVMSAFYMFLDLLIGKLPWTREAQAKDKEAVSQLKSKYVEAPEKFIVDDALMALHPYKKKLAGGVREIAMYIEGLGYSEKPDYSRLRKMYSKLSDYAEDGEEEKFDWVGAGSPPWQPLVEAIQQDEGVKASFLGQQVDELQGDIRRYGRSEAEVARVWANATKKVLDYKNEKQAGHRRSLMQSIMAVAKRHDCFFCVPGLDDELFQHIQLDLLYTLEKGLKETMA